MDRDGLNEQLGINVRQANLDDWTAAKALWREFIQSKHSWRIEGTLDTFSHYFSVSLTSPVVRFIILREHGVPAGFAILDTCLTPISDHNGLPLPPETNSFLRMVFVRPGVSARASRQLSQALTLITQMRGSKKIIGHCCLDFPVAAYERLHGVKPLYIVVAKEV